MRLKSANENQAARDAAQKRRQDWMAEVDQRWDALIARWDKPEPLLSPPLDRHPPQDREA